MSRLLTYIVIVLALGGAALLGYRAWIAPAPAAVPIVAEGGRSNAILPMGTNLNFDSVKQYNKDGRLFQYPVVTPGEIGPELGTIIKQ